MRHFVSLCINRESLGDELGKISPERKNSLSSCVLHINIENTIKIEGPFLKILFLQEQPCIRTLKYAKGLKERIKNIRLYFGYCGSTLSAYYGQGDEFFDGWFKLNGDAGYTLNTIVRKVQPDLIHCHNAPDSLTVASIRCFRGLIPIVHDIHDLMTLRTTKYDDGIKRDQISSARIECEEKISFEKSDGIITVSDEIFEIAIQKYNLDGKKYLVFPNYVMDEMIPVVLREKLSTYDGMIHIVYEGHLDRGKTGGHYDLYDIFKEIVRQEIHVHLYPSKQNDLYMKLGEEEDFIHYHGHLSPKNLMMELTRYDFGWSGFNVSKNKAHVDTVLANKTIEYVSAGLPVISFAHKAQKRFINRYGVGIIIENLSNLAEKLSSSDIDEVKNLVLEKRHTFTVENQIGNLYRFYLDLVLKKGMKNEDY